MNDRPSFAEYQKATMLTEAMNKIFFNEPFIVQELLTCVQMAEQHEMLRLIASAYRDNIIIKNDLFIVKSPDFNDALDKSKAFLLRTSKRPEQLIEIYWQDGSVLRKAQGVEDILHALRPFLENIYGPTSNAGWQTFISSCQQSVDNEAMSTAYKKRWTECIKARRGNAPFWDWLFSLPLIDSNQILGQLGIFDSRPIAPLFKMKQQLTTEEAIQYSPEFGLDIPIVMTALHHSLAVTHMGNNSPQLQEIISSEFPETYCLWEKMLSSKNKNKNEYVPIFLHPLTIPLTIKNFREYIESEYLIIDRQVYVSSKSTLSFRSMQPNNGHAIIKLPVPIQIMHIMRRIHIEELELGVGFSQKVDNLILEDLQCKDRFIITKDIAAASISYIDDDLVSQEHAKYFSFVLRETPLKYANTNEIVLPLATLFVAIPGGKQLLFEEIMYRKTQNKKEAKMIFVENHIKTILDCLLSMFFKHGIMPEAHQQNINVVFDKNGTLKKFLYHDNVGGTAVFVPYFKYSEAYSVEFSQLPFARQEPQRVILQFVHATLSAHIIPLINVLSDEMGFERAKLTALVIQLFQDHVHQARKEMEHMQPSKKNALNILLKAFEDGVLNTSTLPSKRIFARFYLQSQIENWGEAPNFFDLDNNAIPPDGEIDNVFLTNKCV